MVVVKPPATATQDDTVRAIAERARRRRAPVRRAFVQAGSAGKGSPGPLAVFVTNGDETALDAYLLIAALASSSSPYDVTFHSQIWARALGMPNPESKGPAVSKILARLRARQLISVTRVGRLAKISLLREDGTGADYTRPGVGNNDAHLQIPVQYWTSSRHWYRRLSLAAKAVLLIALTQRQPFVLPLERAKAWYGLSPETTGKGLNELESVGLLKRHDTFKPAPLAPAGVTLVRNYTLKGDLAITTARRPRVELSGPGRSSTGRKQPASKSRRSGAALAGKPRSRRGAT